ncbi:hypothetical protein Barb7_00273 [Bacteroidales bacterium Barb7]|nr:hypothetical protein Barb7_00273 [Bacteroidales bacterium Barb7]
MFKSGSVLYGLFNLRAEQKRKYVIILHNDGQGCVITTFTTSQIRGSLNPSHGANPKDNPVCYVFQGENSYRNKS